MFLDNIKFKGRLKKDNKTWVYGYYIFNGYKHFIYSADEALKEDAGQFDGKFMYEVEGNSVEQYSGLNDLQGKEIYSGDILLFNDEDGVWIAAIEHTRGVFGINYLYLKQIQNPDNWNEEWDKVNTRGWASKWGYEEIGTAFTYRKPLSQISTFRGNNKEYWGSDYYKWHEKYGFGKYRVEATIVGNLAENKDIFKDDEKLKTFVESIKEIYES